MGSRKKMKILDVGGKDGSRCQKHYPEDEITVLDIIYGWDVMENGLPEGDWDIIFSNHSIEHFPDPDFFLEECKRIMNQHTILELGTPNLAAWFNRILFLFGYVPHCVELSKKFNVGKPFNWGNEPMGGHIYVYTVPALKDLLKKHGFSVTSTTGESSTYPCNIIIRLIDKLATWISPNLASAVRLKCILKEPHGCHV